MLFEAISTQAAAATTLQYWHIRPKNILFYRLQEWPAVTRTEVDAGFPALVFRTVRRRFEAGCALP